MKKAAVVVIILFICSILLLINDYFGEDIVNTNNFSENNFSEGVFKGKGTGFAGEITVEVVFKKVNSESVIMTEIRVLEEEEVLKYWLLVKDKVIGEVLAKQNIEIDTITGATESSEGLLEAIKNARKKADSRI